MGTWIPIGANLDWHVWGVLWIHMWLQGPTSGPFWAPNGTELIQPRGTAIVNTYYNRTDFHDEDEVEVDVSGISSDAYFVGAQ